MRLIVSMTAMLLLGTTAVQAKDPASGSDPDKVVCKRVYDADTGSHFQSSKRVCRKASEWREIESGNERLVQQVRDGGSVSGMTSSGGGSPR